MQIDIHFYNTKKFQGLVLSFDCDPPQLYVKTYCVIQFKFLFVGFWIRINEKK